MTEVETKVFDTETLGRRILRKKVLGRVPFLPLAALLIVASFAAAAFFALGPATPQAVNLGKLQGSGLPSTDILYGQVGGAPIYFWINVTLNSYTQAHSAYNVIEVYTSGTSFPNVGACTGELLVEQSNNQTTPTWTTITPTWLAANGGTCVYTASLTQSVNPGKIGTSAPTWPFRVTYVASPVGRGPAYNWSNQFWGT